MAKTIYEELIALTSDLLGPASARFIDRQIISHLAIEPDTITAKEVGQLSHWIRLSISVLSDDEDMIQAYTSALERLSREQTV